MKNAVDVLVKCGLYGQDLKDKKIPVDIIGMSDFGEKLAEELAKIVGEKEVCYYDDEKRCADYHFLDFDKMLGESKFMFVTDMKYEKLIRRAKLANKHIKIVKCY